MGPQGTGSFIIHTRTHHTARERALRKAWLVKRVKLNPGVDENTLRRWFMREYGLTARKFSEYLKELLEMGELKREGDRLFDAAFEFELVQSWLPIPVKGE